MKKQLLLICFAVTALAVSSCGVVDTDSEPGAVMPSDNDLSSAVSSQADDSEVLSEKNNEDSNVASSSTEEKVYTITAGNENSWDITDKETIADIDSWLEKTDKMLDDCALEEGDYPMVGGTEGIIIKTDGDNYEKMYFITTTRLDLTQYTEKKYEHQENFAVNQKAYELPWEHIDIITEIIENSKP